MEGPAESDPPGDLLELYALQRLLEDELAKVEEHLLICQACRNRLLEAQRYVAALRAALRKIGGVGAES